MTENLIGSMETGVAETELTKFQVTPISLDGTGEQDVTRWFNHKFAEQYGYYIGTTEIREIYDAKAKWTTGKGVKADSTTTFIINSISGNGKDTFNSILENMIAMMEIGEDSYAQIIRDDERNLINLKPLNTERVTIVAGRDGIINFYEYDNGSEEKQKIIEATDMFHLSRNRRGDEIHGRSIIVALKKLIDAKQQAIEDQVILNHSFVVPRIKHKMKTDDPAEIAAYKKKQDNAKVKGLDIYEPMDVAEAEIFSVAPNSTINQMAWIQYIDAAIYKAAGVPQFIVGGGTGFTEASEKISYLAWQQTVEKLQLFIEEQVGKQLGLTIELEFPASLENELLSDNKKDGPQNIDASETTAGIGQ